MSAFRPGYEEGDVEGHARIHLNTERWRVCEAFFSPGMAGVDSAGIGEVIQSLVPSFIESKARPGSLDFPEDRAQVLQNVYLTGSASQLAGLVPRLQAVLQSLLPPGSPVNVVRSPDPGFDAWRGMAAFSLTPEFASTGLTKAEYEEYGGERIKRWWGGNWNGTVVSQPQRGDGDAMDIDG